MDKQKIKMNLKKIKRQMEEYSKLAIKEPTCQALISRVFIFGITNEIPFTNSLVFKEDFTIDGYSDPNEKFWGIYGDKLKIFDINNTLTSVFTIVDGRIETINGQSTKFKNVSFELQTLKRTTIVNSSFSTHQLSSIEDPKCYFRIQNVLIPKDNEDTQLQRDLYYRGNEVLNYNGISLIDGAVDFNTYLNMLSIKKWCKYTESENFVLSIRAKGKFKLKICYSSLLHNNNAIRSSGIEQSFLQLQNSEIDDIFIRNAMNYQSCETEVSEDIYEYSYDCDEVSTQEILVPIEKNENSMVGFSLEGSAQIYDAAWYAIVNKNTIRTINIALNTTTFKKEMYVLKNLNKIQKEILEETTEEKGLNDLGNHFFLNVIDNGKTLDIEKINNNRVRVYYNPNVGGAGGFTRGMIETLNLEKNNEFMFSHILFMDDDIEVLPESFKRTYALLCILRDRYQDHFISGAMLDSLDGVTQYEDTGFVSRNKDTAYLPTKDKYNLTVIKDVLKNDIEYPVKDQYAAWWYCVVPKKYIHDNSMSLPIFYRGDDIEFSIRNNAKIITLNSICVWHLPFYTKKSKALENYLVSRNSLIDQSVNDFVSDVNYIEKYIELYKKELRMFNYGAADQVLDALDDYLRGPDYIATLDGIDVIRRESAKNEVFSDDIPIEVKQNLHTVDEYCFLNPQDLRVFIDTNNGHGLPDFVFNKWDDRLENVSIVNQEMLENPGKQFMKKRIVVYDTYNKKIAIRERNQIEYEKIEKRYRELIKKYDEEGELVSQRYRDSAEKFHSKEFWVEYLGLNNNIDL